jgi:polyisoprenoid-binding protein YceI
MRRFAAATALAALLAPTPVPARSAPRRPVRATAAASAPAARPQAGPPFRLVLAPTGNQATWRVRERLVSFDFPNDAVGTTHDLGGAIVVGGGWQPDSTRSKITVNLTTLKSDRAMRDHYIQRRTLETDRFPTAVLVPTRFERLRTPLRDGRTFTFEVVGDLTLHGVTRPTTWLVTAAPTADGYAGTAQTQVKFEDFGMTQPRVRILLSIEDAIHLEFHFNFVRDTTWHG